MSRSVCFRQIFQCLISCGIDGSFLGFRAWNVMSYSLRPIIGSERLILNIVACLGAGLHIKRLGRNIKHAHSDDSIVTPDACPWLQCVQEHPLLSLLSALHRLIPTVNCSCMSISDCRFRFAMHPSTYSILLNEWMFCLFLLLWSKGFSAWNHIMQVCLNIL